MMKAVIFSILLFLCISNIHAQNVGIGATKPEDKLTVAGTIRSNLNSNSTMPQIKLMELGDDFARIMFNNDNATSNFTLAGKPSALQADAKFNIFYSDFGNVLTATGTGRLGVNVSNPIASLHVNSELGTDPFRVQYNGGTKFRIFSNNALSFGSNWQNPIQDAMRFSTSHMIIGHEDAYVPTDLVDVNGTVRMTGFRMPVGHAKNYVLTSDDTGEGYWAALPEDKVNDEDPNPTNELQTISKNGSTVTLSNGGGSFVDDDTDADSNPTNELQNLSLNGNTLSISNGNSVALPAGGAGGEFISDASGFNVVHTDYSNIYEGITIKTDNEVSFLFSDSYYGKAMSFNNSNFNVSIAGFEPMTLNTGQYNVAIGNFSQAASASGDKNVIIGFNGGRQVSGSENIIIGNTSGNNSGTRNVTIGNNSGQNTVGNEIISIGTLAGNGAGQQSIYLGHLSGTNGQGNWNRGGAIGYGATTTSSNQYVIGNGNTVEIGGYEPWSNLSDGRFKFNVQENVPGLEFIRQLRPVSYNVDLVKVERFTKGEEGFKNLDTRYLSELRHKSQISESGFIAQEVEEAAKQFNYEFNGVVAPQNEGDPYALAYSQFAVPLTKAIQELDMQNQKLTTENQELRERLEKLEDKILKLFK